MDIGDGVTEEAKSEYWQVAAGDTRRDYVKLCLDWGVILNGPGAPGPWTSNRDGYRNDHGPQKASDLARFCETIQSGDRVALNLGLSTISGLGIVVGPYEWNDHFGDIDGWDIQHLRRVNWFWKQGGSDSAPPPFDSRELKRGTTQRLGSESVRTWFEEEWIKAGKPEADPAALPPLPANPPEAITVESIGESLFDQGIGASFISETIARIADIKRLADWYWRVEDRPSESETVAHLVVPLLQTLGWTPQRLAVEWKQVDLALFDAVPRADKHLSTIVEVKKMDEACLSAKAQAEGYALAKGRERCRRLIVTDGMRYGVFTRSEDGRFADYPDAYMNLRRLVRIYPLLRSPASELAGENGAARAMALMSADLQI